MDLIARALIRFVYEKPNSYTDLRMPTTNTKVYLTIAIITTAVRVFF